MPDHVNMLVSIPEIIISIKLKIIYKMACEWYNFKTKDVDGFFVLWLEKLMRLEGKEN